MKKVCIITGTRAEYGLLKPLIKGVSEEKEFELQLVVTGMHLSPEFGLTYKEIENDGYKINEKIEIILSSDTPIGISKSMGLAMISFAESFNRLKPDIVIVLGDRYEIFAAVSAASISRLPVVHLHGGETTEGAIDEAFRHSITKMSYLHFTSTEDYRRRVIQLGEDPSRVFNVGAIGVDSIKNLKLLTKEQLEESLDFKLDKKFALVTFHPVTLEENTSKKQFQNLLEALSYFKNLKVIFTKANSDTDGRIINMMIEDYVNNNSKRAKAFHSLGQLRYLSTMKYASVVIGNSSSGILEAPSFKVPTINIGDRQKGRIQAESILNCVPKTGDIIKKIDIALNDTSFRKRLEYVKNPYGDGNATEKIISTLKKFFSVKHDLKKTFYDL